MNKDREELTSIFTTIAASANENDTSNPPMLLALELVLKFINGDIAHAFGVDEKKRTIVSLPLWVQSSENKKYDRFMQASMDKSFDPIDGMPGRIMNSKEPEWIEDTSQDPNFLRNKVAKLCELKGAFAFPVLVKNEVVAVLEFFADEAMKPNRELMNWLKPFGIQLGRSIEREKSARALEHSEQKYKLIVENISDAFYAMDENYRFTYINPVAEKYFRTKSEDLVGRVLWDAIPVAKNSVFQHRYEEAMATQRPTHFETMSPLTHHWVEMHAYPSPKGISVFFQDVHRRKEAEIKLKESEERFRLMVTNVRDYAILMLSPEGQIVSWNIGAERIKGYRDEEIIGRNYSIFYQDEDRRKGVPEQNLKVAQEKGRLDLTGPRLRKDGSVFYAHVVITALRSEDGKLRGFAKVTQDITIQHITRIQLEEKTRDLIRSNSDLEQFAYVVSHDLREPLRMIASYSELLMKKFEPFLGNDEETRKYASYVTEGSERMESLIQSILHFSRAGRAPVLKEPTSVNECLSYVLHDLERLIAESGGEVTTQSLPKVWVTPVHLEQILQNLVTNALKFRRPEEPPRICVGAKHEGDKLIVSVSDNGIGVPPEESDIVFQPFRRIPHKKKYPGSGVGLAITKKLVERNGGNIWYRPSRNGGTTFYFSLDTYHPEYEVPRPTFEARYPHGSHP